MKAILDSRYGCKATFTSAMLAVAICTAFLPAVGHAFINSNMPVLDINFDSDTNGTAPVVYFPSAMPIPADHPQAYGYFPPTGPVAFTETNGISFRVDDVAGMSKAVVMSNAAPATATSTHVSFLDHNFSVPAASRSRLEFDFSQLQTPGGTNGGFRSDWLIVAFKQNVNPTQVAFAIGTRHGFPGQIFLQQNAPNNIPIGTYTNGVPTHVELVTYNEGGGRFDVWLNGQLAAHDIPFNSPMFNDNDQVKELFIQQIAGENSVNVVAYDNFQYTLLIPEPSSLVLIGAGLGALVARRFRRS